MNPNDRRCAVCDSQPVTAPNSRTCEQMACRLEYRRHLELGRATCSICGMMLAAQRKPLAAQTCGSGTCNVAEHRNQTREVRRCEICNVPLPSHRDRCCDDRECTVVHAGRRVAEKEQELRERTAALTRAAEQLRDSILDSTSESVEKPCSVAVVPHTRAQLCPTDPQRQQQFIEFLRGLVSTAFHQPPADSDSPYAVSDYPEDASLEENPIIGTACRLCRGHCCVQGGNHAFLSVSVMREFMARNPEFSEDQVAEEYLRHLPELTIEGSCVYHGERGCGLPREMRGLMCNRWLCPGLKAVRETLAENFIPSFFVTSTEGSEIVASEFARTGREE